MCERGASDLRARRPYDRRWERWTEASDGRSVAGSGTTSALRVALVHHEGPQHVGGTDDQVLTSGHLVRDRSVAHRRVEARLPQRVAGRRVERDDVAGRTTGEEQVAGGREQAGARATFP